MIYDKTMFQYIHLKMMHKKNRTKLLFTAHILRVKSFISVQLCVPGNKHLLKFTCAFLFSKCILRFFWSPPHISLPFWHYYSSHNQIIKRCVVLCFWLPDIFPLHFGVLQGLSLLLVHLHVIYSVLIRQKWLLCGGKNMQRHHEIKNSRVLCYTWKHATKNLVSYSESHSSWERWFAMQ